MAKKFHHLNAHQKAPREHLWSTPNPHPTASAPLESRPGGGKASEGHFLCIL
jgi:hypothetical protein